MPVSRIPYIRKKIKEHKRKQLQGYSGQTKERNPHCRLPQLLDCKGEGQHNTVVCRSHQPHLDAFGNQRSFTGGVPPGKSKPFMLLNTASSSSVDELWIRT